MWTSVYMTQNIDTARAVRTKIENNSIITAMRRICDENSNGTECYDILVPRAELDAALEILIDD